MPKITFITQAEETITVEGDASSIMELAKENDIPGIDGDCGGVCSCATCHVHVAPEFWEKVGEPNSIEKDMLELDDNYNEYSRLGCQIDISEDLDGVVLKVAN